MEVTVRVKDGKEFLLKVRMDVFNDFLTEISESAWILGETVEFNKKVGIRCEDIVSVTRED